MPDRIKNITRGEKHSGSLGQPDLLVMPKTLPNKKALLNEQGLGFRQAAASYFSLSSLSRATSIACVRSLIAGEFFFTKASSKESKRCGSLIETGTRSGLDIDHLFNRQYVCFGFRDVTHYFFRAPFGVERVFNFSGRLKHDLPVCDLQSRVIALPVGYIDSKHLLLLYCWFNIQALINAASSLPSSVVSIRFKNDLRLSKQSVQPWYEYAPAFELEATLNSDFAFTKSTSSFSKQRYATASAKLVRASLFSSIWFAFIIFFSLFSVSINYIQRNTMYAEGQEKSLQSDNYFYICAKQRKNKSFIRAAAPHFLGFDGITVAAKLHTEKV